MTAIAQGCYKALGMLIVPNFDAKQTNRAHPWTVTEYKAGSSALPGRYYNFIERPDLIPHVLEDFKPFENRPAVQHFYAFLKWINGPTSILETNDSSMRPPRNAEDTLFRSKIKIEGRVDFFYRSHVFNTTEYDERFCWLVRMACLYLQRARPDFYKGVLTVCVMNTRYLLLPQANQQGRRISLFFNVYGDSEDETFDRLFIMFDGIFEATKRVCSAIGDHVPDFP